MSSCGVTGAMLFYWTAILRHLSIALVYTYILFACIACMWMGSGVEIYFTRFEQTLFAYTYTLLYAIYILSQIINRTYSPFYIALQEPQNKISLHTYIAVSLCAVAVAVIAIMSAFVANYLYKRHRIKQQMNKAFQVLTFNSSIYTYSHSSIRQVLMPLISIRELL